MAIVRQIGKQLITAIWIGVMIAVLIPGSGVVSASEPQRITFNSGIIPPSDLRQKRAHEMGVDVTRPPYHDVSGFLYDAKDSDTAVVIVPSCLGLKDFHHDWARRLVSWGHMALILDVPIRNDKGHNCPGENLKNHHASGLIERAYDIYGAHTLLMDKMNNDSAKVAIIGWGYNGMLGAVMEDGVHNLYDAGFAGVVAFYPPCRTIHAGRVVAPLLVLVGEQDNWAPSKPCRAMAERSRDTDNPVSLFVLPGAQHGFDNPDNRDETLFSDVWNPNKVPTKGAIVAYDRHASKASRAKVKEFLQQRL